MSEFEIWKGHHGPEAREKIARAWSEERLLVLCPPTVDVDFPGFRFLPPHVEWADGRREKPVLGLFTTGTSAGEAKLVLYSKSCIRASLSGIMSFFDKRRIDSIFCYPQPFHTFGLLLGYILTLENEWPLYAPEGKYSTAAHEQRLALTSPGLLTLGTPTHFQDLMAFATERGTIAPSYSCIVGGAAVPVALWHRLQSELKIEAPSIGYGATEASPGVAHLPAGQAPREDREVGLPLPQLSLTLQPGRGYEFTGPGVCLAMVYADRIEFPEKIFVSDDLNRREDGVLVFGGRSDLVLNRGGEKFALESIEDHLRRTLQLEALAFPVADARLGQELGLLFMQDFDSDTVVRVLQQRFNVRFAPNAFRRVERFPLNASLKVDRKGAAALL